MQNSILLVMSELRGFIMKGHSGYLPASLQAVSL
jgi:hypothetical protein